MLPCRNTPGRSSTYTHGSTQPCLQQSGRTCKTCSGSTCTTSSCPCLEMPCCTRHRVSTRCSAPPHLRQGAVRSISEPPTTAFPNWGWQEGRNWGFILHQQDLQTTLSCTEVTWGHPGTQHKPWPHLAPLTPSKQPLLLLSKHPKPHQKSHLKKWSRRSKGPLCSCLWDRTHGGIAWPLMPTQHWLTKGRMLGRVPQFSYSPEPHVPSLPQSSAYHFAMDPNPAVGRGSLRTMSYRTLGSLTVA